MALPTLLYLFPYVLSALISAGVGLYALNRRTVAGAVPFAWTALLQALASAGFILELLSLSLQAKIFWDNVQFVIIAISPLVILAFVFRYTGRRLAHPWRTFGLLAAPIALFLLLLATDDWHGLIRPEAWLIPGQPFAELVYDFTLAVKLFALYGFGLVLAGIAFLALFFAQSPHLYRIQIAIIILGILFPLIGSALTLSGVSLGLHRDTAPLTTAIRSLLIAWALFRYHLLDVVPIAWNTVVENITDAVIVLDARLRLVDLNPAARKLTGSVPSEIVGKPFAAALANWPELVAYCQEQVSPRPEITLDVAGEHRYFDPSCVPVHDKRGQFTGHVLMLRDVTERRRAQEALQQAHDELEQRVAARTEEVAQRIEELHSLNELNHLFSTRSLPEQVIETALQEIVESITPDLALVYLREGRDLRLTALYPPAAGLQLQAPEAKHVGECLCGLAASLSRPQYSTDINRDPRCTLPECKQAGMRSFAALPLISQAEVLGVLGLASVTERDFSKRSAFLEALAGEVALGLQNAHLHTRLEQYTAGLEETVAQRTRELQAERDRTQAILETVAESVVVADTQGRILYMNPATVTLTGYSSEKIVGQRAWLWIDIPEYDQVWDEIRETLGTGQIWRDEMPSRRQDGTSYDAAVTVAPLFDLDNPEQLIGSVWAQRDITLHKEAERLKDKFVSSVSHELRTPLSVITLASDSLEAFHDRMTEDVRHSMLRDIREQAHVLNDLIGDVLEISRIDSGYISTERAVVNLSQLVHNEVERQRPLAEKKSQILAATDSQSLFVQANAGQIGQIVRNVLHNAIKYTPEGGQITCECLLQEEDQPEPGSQWVVLRVSDTGTGIAPEHLPHIFERFYRVQTQSSIPGTGLGLSIARELVELHGGHIAVSSHLGQGTTFSVYLPLLEERGP
jgi:PAS domain S-box-containing protein